MEKFDQLSKAWVYTHVISPIMESGTAGFWTYELHKHYDKTGLDNIYASIYTFAQENGVDAAQATLREKDRSYLSL